MMEGARLVAEASAAMVAAAKDAARNPNDPEKQRILAEAVAAVERAMMIAQGDNVRRKIYSKLAAASKQVAASTTQLMGASKNAAPSNRS